MLFSSFLYTCIFRIIFIPPNYCVFEAVGGNDDARLMFDDVGWNRKELNRNNMKDRTKIVALYHSSYCIMIVLFYLQQEATRNGSRALPYLI